MSIFGGGGGGSSSGTTTTIARELSGSRGSKTCAL